MATRRRKLWWTLGVLLFLLVVVPVLAVAVLAIDENPPPIDGFSGYRRAVADGDNGRVILALGAGEVAWPPLDAAGEAAGTTGADADAGEIADEWIVEADVFAASHRFDTTAAKRVVELNTEVLHRLELALVAPDFQFAVSHYAGDTENLIDYRDLAYVLGTRARLALEAGDAAAALGDVRRQLALGRRLQEGQGSIVHYVIGVSIQQHALGHMLDWLPRLALAGDRAREAIALIDAELAAPQALPDALRVEFAQIDGLVASFLAGDAGKLGLLKATAPSWATRLCRPFLLPNQTRRLLAEHLGAIIAAADLPAAERSLVELVDRLRLRSWTCFIRNGLGKYLLAPTAGNLAGFLETRDAHLAKSRATQAVIALRAYREEHGALPGSLADLVSHWLAAVPRDPFSGEELRYDRARGLVYSVGKDLTDDGGSKKEPRAARADEHEPTFTIDPPPFPPAEAGSAGAPR